MIYVKYTLNTYCKRKFRKKVPKVPIRQNKHLFIINITYIREKRKKEKNEKIFLFRISKRKDGVNYEKQ